MVFKGDGVSSIHFDFRRGSILKMRYFCLMIATFSNDPGLPSEFTKY
jgi:hypothetical protein